MQLLLHRRGGSTADVGGEMHLTALPSRPLELHANRGGEPAMVVGDNEVDAGDPAPSAPLLPAAPSPRFPNMISTPFFYG